MTNIHNQILPVGTKLGVYEIKEASKIDAFDITYHALNHHLKERVEILEYFPHDFAIRANDGIGIEFKSPNDKENFDYGLKAFLGQAEILTEIEHPNIVKVENILLFNGTAYLIMAYQEGVPLSRLVGSQASFAETELKFILLSILDALKTVHKHEIVHGGIQPEGIVLGKNGEPLLTGFANARLAIATQTGKLADILAPGYAPPELYGHANAPAPASDFYGLGATMYYCITHEQPIAALDRISALNKGEPDPIASLSRTLGTTYSPELLQAIDWMLRPKTSNRPRSVSEIITLLHSAPTSDQDRQITSKQDAIVVPDSGAIVKDSLSIGAMVGIIGLVIAVLWFVTKPPEITGDKARTATAQPSIQGKPDNSTALSAKKEDQTVAQSDAKLSQVPEPDKVTETAKMDIVTTEKLPKPSEEEIQLKTNADDKSPKENIATEKPSSPASKPRSKPEAKVETTTKKDSGVSQKMPVVDNPQLKKQKLPAKPIQEGSINGYLAAAKKAMKEVRFTTPPGDNAYQYYQLVLVKEPDNAEALAGLQKIVDRYAWFIRKSKAEGKVDMAKRVLEKAESVLPNDPKLHKIREELANSKE